MFRSFLRIERTPDTMVRGLLPFPMKLLTEYVYSGKFVLFSRPDYTVGTGIPPAINTGGHRFSRFERVADYTAGWDFHPTPKIYSFYAI